MWRTISLFRVRPFGGKIHFFVFGLNMPRNALTAFPSFDLLCWMVSMFFIILKRRCIPFHSDNATCDTRHAQSASGTSWFSF